MSPEKFKEILNSSIITGFISGAKTFWSAAWPYILIFAAYLVIRIIYRTVRHHSKHME